MRVDRDRRSHGRWRCVGAAGSASAATPDHAPAYGGCSDGGGWWNGYCNGYGNRGDFYRNGFIGGNGFVGGGGVVVIVLG